LAAAFAKNGRFLNIYADLVILSTRK